MEEKTSTSSKSMHRQKLEFYQTHGRWDQVCFSLEKQGAASRAGLSPEELILYKRALHCYLSALVEKHEQARTAAKQLESTKGRRARDAHDESKTLLDQLGKTILQACTRSRKFLEFSELTKTGRDSESWERRLALTRIVCDLFVYEWQITPGNDQDRSSLLQTCAAKLESGYTLAKAALHPAHPTTIGFAQDLAKFRMLSGGDQGLREAMVILRQADEEAEAYIRSLGVSQWMAETAGEVTDKLRLAVTEWMIGQVEVVQAQEEDVESHERESELVVRTRKTNFRSRALIGLETISWASEKTLTDEETTMVGEDKPTATNVEAPLGGGEKECLGAIAALAQVFGKREACSTSQLPPEANNRFGEDGKKDDRCEQAGTDQPEKGVDFFRKGSEQGGHTSQPLKSMADRRRAFLLAVETHVSGLEMKPKLDGEEITDQQQIKVFDGDCSDEYKKTIVDRLKDVRAEVRREINHSASSARGKVRGCLVGGGETESGRIDGKEIEPGKSCGQAQRTNSDDQDCEDRELEMQFSILQEVYCRAANNPSTPITDVHALGKRLVERSLLKMIMSRYEHMVNTRTSPYLVFDTVDIEDDSGEEYHDCLS